METVWRRYLFFPPSSELSRMSDLDSIRSDPVLQSYISVCPNGLMMMLKEVFF